MKDDTLKVPRPALQSLTLPKSSRNGGDKTRRWVSTPHVQNLPREPWHSGRINPVNKIQYK